MRDHLSEGRQVGCYGNLTPFSRSTDMKLKFYENFSLMHPARRDHIHRVSLPLYPFFLTLYPLGVRNASIAVREIFVIFFFFAE